MFVEITKKKLVMAFVFNFLIFVLEVVGLVLSIQRHGMNVFCYYTENSNYFAGIVSAVFCVVVLVCILKKKLVPNWLHLLRFVSTVCLSITILVVSFVFVPMFPKTAELMMLQNSNLYEHFLCPMLSIMSFVLLENQVKLSKISVVFSLVPTIVYGVVIVILNVLKVVRGPYPFLLVYEIKWWLCALFLIGLFVIAVLTSLTIFAFHNYSNKRFSNRQNLV